MKYCISEALEKQAEIIKMQTEIIDHLAATVLQYGAIADADLELMKQAAELQEKTKE